MKLNVWQRLWVLLSVIWFFPVAVGSLVIAQLNTGRFHDIFANKWPRYRATTDLIRKEASLKLQVADGTMIVNVPKRISKEELEQLYVRYLKRVRKMPRELRLKFQTPSENQPLEFDLLVAPVKELWNRGPHVDSWRGVAQVQQRQEAYSKWIDFSEIENEYKTYMRPIHWEQAKIATYGFLAWLGSIGLVYLLGAGVGRVVRGFSQGR